MLVTVVVVALAFDGMANERTAEGRQASPKSQTRREPLIPEIRRPNAVSSYHPRSWLALTRWREFAEPIMFPTRNLSSFLRHARMENYRVDITAPDLETNR